MKTVNIFISSPGDVIVERRKAREVIDQLQHIYVSRLQLRPILWEDLPLGADTSFQEGIDLLLSRKYNLEIAVFIVWSRLGSPLGPPLRPDGTPYRSGTEREFEFMLQARARSGGKRPHILVYTRDDADSFGPILDPRKSSEELKDLIGQRELARQFIRENFQDEKDRNIRAYWTYDKPISFATRLKVHLRALLDEILGEEAAPDRVLWEESPYRGLEMFDLRHAPIYFGRENEACDLELLLRRRAELGNASVIVVGGSGVGKSSLARAGVAYSLAHRNLDEAIKSWRFAQMRPGGVQGNLFGALVRALVGPDAIPELAADGAKAIEAFRHALATDPDAALALKFDGALRVAAESARGPVKLLLLVDQLEELWLEKEITSEVREGFLRTLHALAANGSVWVLCTLRSDVYSTALLSEAFARFKRPAQEGGDCDGIFDLGSPDPISIHRLIREPAAMAGLRFEKQERTGRTLDQELLKDSLGHPDALPLLEYALEQLFEKRTADGLLTFAAYEELGGVEGALGKRADQSFAALPVQAQSALPEILPLLVSVDVSDVTKTSRRQARLADLTATEGRRMLTESLIASRFLTTNDVNGVPMAGLAHEALLRRWNRVQTWLEENRELLQMQEHVRGAASDWRREMERRKGNANDLLLTAGLPLFRGEGALKAGVLDRADREFVELSMAREREAQQKKRRFLQTIALVSTLAALILAFATGLVVIKAQEVKKLLAESDVERADELFAKGDAASALWYLCRAVSSGDPDPRTAERLWFALAQRSWPLPVIDPVKVGGDITAATFDSTGSRFAIATKQGTVSIFNSTDGSAIGPSLMHPKEVRCLQFSPDGSMLLTACDDAVSRLWDMRKPSTAPVASNQHGDEVIGIAWSSDGSQYATGSRDKQLRVWDPAHPDQPVFQVAMKDKVHTVAFDPTNASRVLGVAKDEVCVWDTKSTTPVLDYHADEDLNGASFSPDGTKVLSFGDDAVVISAFGGLEDWVRLSLQGSGRAAAISPDGKMIAVASGTHVVCYPLEQNPEKLWDNPFSDNVSHIKFTNEGKRLVTACDDGKIEVFDTQFGHSISEPIIEAGTPLALDFQQTGNRILSARTTQTVRIWSLSPPSPLPAGVLNLGSPPLLLNLGSEVRCVAGNGHGLAFAPPSGDWPNLQTSTFDFKAPLVSAVILPSGTTVAGTADGGVFALENGQAREVGRLNAAVSQLAFSASGTLLAAGAEDGGLGLWRWPQGDAIALGWKHDQQVSGLTILEPGSAIVSASWDRFLARTDWQTAGAGPKRWALGSEPQVVVANPARSLGLVGLSSGEIWTVGTATEEARLAFRVTSEPSSAAFSANGEMAAIGTVAGTVTIWDMRKSAKVSDITCGVVSVSAVCFGRNGRWLGAATDDGQVCIYDTSSGRAVTEAMMHAQGVRQMFFSADEQYLVTAAQDGMISIWPLMRAGDAERAIAIARHEMQDAGADRHFTPPTAEMPKLDDAGLSHNIANLGGGGKTMSDEITLLNAYRDSSVQAPGRNEQK